jgi:hypothetical protein
VKVEADADQSKPISRREGESSRAFDALQDYAELGINRSVPRLYEKYLNEKRDPMPSKSTLYTWCSNFDWNTRIKGIESENAQKRMNNLNAVHTEAVEAYRQSVNQMGGSLMNAAAHLLLLVKERIKTLEASDISPQDVGSFVRAAVQASQLGVELRAQALGLDTLLEQVKATPGESS